VSTTGTEAVPFVNVTDVADRLQTPGEGIPEQDKSTVPVNPEKPFTLRANESVNPEGALALDALVETEKPDTCRFKVPIFEPEPV